MNRSYIRGYNFERRVIKHFESMGYIVIRQGKSKFPDLWVIDPVTQKAFPCECKINKYLNKSEREKAIELTKKGFRFRVAYRKGYRTLKFYEIINGGKIIE